MRHRRARGCSGVGLMEEGDASLGAVLDKAQVRTLLTARRHGVILLPRVATALANIVVEMAVAGAGLMQGNGGGAQTRRGAEVGVGTAGGAPSGGIVTLHELA